MPNCQGTFQINKPAEIPYSTDTTEAAPYAFIVLASEVFFFQHRATIQRGQMEAFSSINSVNAPCELSFLLLSACSAQYLSSQTDADGRSALFLIPPGIDRVPWLMLQNRSQTWINESVMRSEPEPAVATESPRLRDAI